jgi:hypothetical protein
MTRNALHGLFLVGLVACGRGGGGEDTETKPGALLLSEALFCGALAAGECNRNVVRACYGSDQGTLARDRSRCIEARQAQCNPGGQPYRAEHALGCLVARQGALADAVWTRHEIAEADEACLKVFSGEGQEGEACASNVDCDAAAGFACIVRPGKPQGICGEPKRVGGGRDCSDPLSVCQDGFYCDPEILSCLAGRNEGRQCSATEPCAAAFYCTNEAGGGCRPKLENGLPCTDDKLCSGGFCLRPAGGQGGVCSATLPLQINAESCDLYR